MSTTMEGIVTAICPDCFEIPCECKKMSKARKPKLEQPMDVSKGVGRGATGRLRNFKAMNAGKLKKTWTDLHKEGWDNEAIVACGREMQGRGLTP
jgi:hypothetical protein